MAFKLVVAGLAAALLSGCAATSPAWDSRFGDAARQLRAAQLHDLQAASRNRGVPLTDGKALAGVQNAYADSYGYAVKEGKAPIFVFSGGGNQ